MEKLRLDTTIINVLRKTTSSYTIYGSVVFKAKRTQENQKTETKLTTQVNEYSSRYQYLFLSLQSNKYR